MQEFILVSLTLYILLYMLASLPTPAPTLCILEHSFVHPIEQQLWTSACPSPIWSLGHRTGCSCPSLDCSSSHLLPLALLFLTTPLRPMDESSWQLSPGLAQCYRQRKKKGEEKEKKKEEKKKKIYIFFLRKGNRRYSGSWAPLAAALLPSCAGYSQTPPFVPQNTVGT